MPLTASGYDVDRFRDIVERLRLDLETSLGTPISTDPDTVIGILTSVIANERSVIENDTQALVNNLSIFTAEDTFLDNLVAYIRLSRITENSALGSLKVWRSGEGVVANEVVFSTLANEQYTCATLTHSLSACAEFLITPINIVFGSVHTVTINNVAFSYTTVSQDTAGDVVDYFATEITNTLGLTTQNDTNRLRVIGEDIELNSLTVSVSNFSLTEIATFNTCSSVLKGNINPVANTITEVVTNNPNILRSNNPIAFSAGNDRESDEELRARHQESIQIGGNATVPAITAKLRQVPSVAHAYIIENTTFEVDGEGRPPKSYECFVVGGDPNAIGQTIWDSKPAGAETYGDITTAVVDNQGNPQSVSWSRPETLYIFIRVTYSLYGEEAFPIDGETKMADALKAYGDTLDIGEDVIPTRFINSIYKTISGVGDVVIEVGSSTNSGDTSPTNGYQTTRLPIASSQTTSFSLGKISFTAV